MENTEGRRGNTRCILRNPEFEVSVGHPGGHSSPGEPRYQSKKLSWTQLLQSLVERNQRVKEGVQRIVTNLIDKKGKPQATQS